MYVIVSTAENFCDHGDEPLVVKISGYSLTVSPTTDFSITLLTSAVLSISKM
jgi:hypothetical protein